MTEYFNDSAHGLGMLVRLGCDLGNHVITGPGLARIGTRDQDILADALVIRRYKTYLAFPEKTAHYLLIGPLQYLDHRALPTAASINS